MAKKAPQRIETRKLVRFLKCQLTPTEILEAGRQQASKHTEYVRVESDRKRVADDFKAKLSALDAEIGSLAGKIECGYEYRNVDCVATLGVPRPGKKRVVRLDTNEEVGVEDMTPEEMQRDLIALDAARDEAPAADSGDPLDV